MRRARPPFVLLLMNALVDLHCNAFGAGGVAASSLPSTMMRMSGSFPRPDQHASQAHQALLLALNEARNVFILL